MDEVCHVMSHEVCVIIQYRYRAIPMLIIFDLPNGLKLRAQGYPIAKYDMIS